MTAIDTLLDRWMNEPGFRTSLTTDPEATVAAAGLSLTDDEWATLKAAVAGLDGGDLGTRLSKDGSYYGKIPN